jgi:hypothetical protein
MKMNTEKIYETAKRVYDAKIRTGLYDHYPPKALDLLWEDCVEQATIMVATTERWFG